MGASLVQRKEMMLLVTTRDLLIGEVLVQRKEMLSSETTRDFVLATLLESLLDF